MKKYLIVVILGLILGFLFATAVYGQENYRTPMQSAKIEQERAKAAQESAKAAQESAKAAQESAKAAQESAKAAQESEVNSNSESYEDTEATKDNEASYFYYKQFTYPYYIAIGDFFETKYALTLRNVKYSDVEFTLAYLQPYVLYDDFSITTASMVALLECVEQNFYTVNDTIGYCNVMDYEEVAQALSSLKQLLYATHESIKDNALKYIESYTAEDFASCVKYMLAIENAYWQVFVTIGSFENSDGYSKVTFKFEQTEE